MRSLRRVLGLGVAALILGAPSWHSASAEPLMTIFSFERSAYDDSKSNQVIVTINRTDQDPASATQEFTVNCKVTGGDAVAPLDYNASFKGATWNFGKVTFPPGVRKQSFAINTYKTSATNKTIKLALSDPEGPGAAVTGDNTTTSLTIVQKK